MPFLNTIEVTLPSVVWISSMMLLMNDRGMLGSIWRMRYTEGDFSPEMVAFYH